MARVWREKTSDETRQNKDLLEVRDVEVSDEFLPPQAGSLDVPTRPEPRHFMDASFTLSEATGLPEPQKRRPNRDWFRRPKADEKQAATTDIPNPETMSTFAMECGLTANAEMNKHFPDLSSLAPSMSHGARAVGEPAGEGTETDEDALSAALAQEISAGGGRLSQRRLSSRTQAVIMALCSKYAGLLQALVLDLREFTEGVIDEIDAEEIQRSEKA
jgi:hypothetical protein